VRKFIEKWKQQAKKLKIETYALYLAYRDPRVPMHARIFAACVVGYAFSPIDLIPDFIPIIGYLDDLILVPLGIKIALSMIPENVMIESREKALEMIRQEKPDLVFLDVMMPKVNGFEICQTVKQDEALKATFVVILTAKGQEADRQRGAQVGADVFMTKPFDPDELIALAASVLKRP